MELKLKLSSKISLLRVDPSDETYDESTCFQYKSKTHKAEDCNAFREYSSHHYRIIPTAIGELDLEELTAAVQSDTTDIPELTFIKNPALQPHRR